MAFLVKADFAFSISLDVLDALTSDDDSIIDELAAEAILEAKSFLNARYDVVQIFNMTGIHRDKTILMYCKDIVLYHIYSIYNFRAIPEIRKRRHEAALKWLHDVNRQIINPVDLPANTTSFIKTGSNEKRINHQQ